MGKSAMEGRKVPPKIIKEVQMDWEYKTAYRFANVSLVKQGDRFNVMREIPEPGKDMGSVFKYGRGGWTKDEKVAMSWFDDLVKQYKESGYKDKSKSPPKR